MSMRMVCMAWMLYALIGMAMPMKAQDTKEQVMTEDSLQQLFSQNKQLRYHYLFLKAVCQKQAGKKELAADLLRQCMALNPKAAETYYLQGQLYKEEQKDTLAFQNFEKAAMLCPENSDYQEKVAQFYIKRGAYDKAIKAYESIYATHHDRLEALWFLVQLYNQQKDYDKMLLAIDHIEQTEGTNIDLILTKMNIYENKGDKKRSYQILKSFVDTHPNNVEYKAMLGNWLMVNNKQKKAYKIYMQAFKDDPNDASVLSALYDYYNKVGEKNNALKLRNRILMSKETPTQTKITMLYQIVRSSEECKGDSTEVLQLFDKVMRANPKEVEIALLDVAYMKLKNFSQDSINAVLQHVIRIAPDNTNARLMLLQWYVSKKDLKEIIELCEQGAQFTPNVMAYYYYLAWAYMQQEQQRKAIDALRRGVSTINAESDVALVSEFYAMLGDLLHQQGEKKSAYEAYDKCLKYKSDNITCLNNYAYFLSEDGKDLQKAEQMSYRVIKAEPNNATYLDTYAWILFLEKRFIEAKLYIDQAVKNDTDSVQSSVVLEHAGDIYALNGQIEGALKYWNKALKVAKKEDKALIQRKIKLKKYIEK